MSTVHHLQYISRNGYRADVGDRVDDPYFGCPKSDLALQVMRDGPVGVAWNHGSERIEKIFNSRVQAALDARSNCVVAIGHWGAPIGRFGVPNNGIVFGADGSIVREIVAPPWISRSDSQIHDSAEALTVVKNAGSGVEIWISHDDGRWHERRLFDPSSGKWGAIVGQYRAV